MKAKALPSLEYLRECFEVSEESPSGLVWKNRPNKHFKDSNEGFAKAWNTRFAGKPAGSLLNRNEGKPYWQISLNGQLLVHRIVYALVNNIQLPGDVEIDHRDLNRLNNNSNNLRLATTSQNGHNVAILPTNTSGVKGVSWHKRSKMWRGQVEYQKRVYSAGYSHSKEIMRKLVIELREKLHKDFTRHI